jgi:hypothetical protein
MSSYGLTTDRLSRKRQEIVPVDRMERLVTEGDLSRALLLFWETFQKIASWHEEDQELRDTIYNYRKRIGRIEDHVGITDPSEQPEEMLMEGLPLVRMECVVCGFNFLVPQTEARDGYLCPDCFAPCVSKDLVPQTEGA